MKERLLRLYRQFVPICIRSRVSLYELKEFIMKAKYKKYQNLKHYDSIVSNLKDKENIKVVFFLYSSSMWKLGDLYDLFIKDKRFTPIIVICPWFKGDKKTKLDLMNDVEDFCVERNYNYVLGYKKQSDTWLDVKKELSPDIVFFAQPYMVDDVPVEFNITSYLKSSLPCYAPYGFNVDGKQQRQFNLAFLNLMWKGFYETPMHKMMAEKYADNKGVNVEVSGYPQFDEFSKIKQNGQTVDCWKIKDKAVKRIIWAPHHTIEENLYSITQFSCFLYYHSFMLELAQKYKSQIQIAFKPHPGLKPHLYAHPDWGKEKTDQYYDTWKNLANGQLEEGGYIDLFLSSDAMIFDSLSFMCEYLYVGKPYIFTMKNKEVKHSFNEFGEEAFCNIYHSYSESDIENFINETVIAGNDPMKSVREKFFREQLLPPNGVSASENIYNTIVSVVSNN